MNLHPLVQASIDLQGFDPDHHRCGCEHAPNRWYLCDYHEGMQDAIDSVEVDLAIAARARAKFGMSGAMPAMVRLILEADRIMEQAEP